MSTSAHSILRQFENQAVLIVGDVMVDRYLTGSVSRISPEAPVPVVLYQSTDDRLGGAANVALNVRALGGIPILCSVVGTDADGLMMRDTILPACGIDGEGLVLSDKRVTTVKTRVLGNHQQMLRIDKEDTHDLTTDEENALLVRVKQLVESKNVRVIVFQDYNKGVLTSRVIERVLELAQSHGIRTAVDPKKHLFFAYKGVDLFKPNLKEVRDSVPFGVHPTVDSLQKAADYLRERLQNRMTMLTLSEKGLYLDNGTDAGRLYPTIPRNISDVSGAGDTVISVAALCLAAGLDMDTMAVLSNLAGGQVCEYPGVVPVRLDVLAAEYDDYLTQHTTP